MSRNNISTIVSNNFRGQDGLFELDLSFNKIQEIASWTFEHLKVNIVYGFISFKERDKSEKLRTLFGGMWYEFFTNMNINGNMYSVHFAMHLSNKFQSNNVLFQFFFFVIFCLFITGAVDKSAMQDLRRLNLAENLIVELVPRVFYMLGKLKYLSLSGNPLIDLPPDVFKDILVRKSFSVLPSFLPFLHPFSPLSS